MSSPRLRLGDELRAGLAGADVNVYDAPPDVVAVPAVVISPGTPYRIDHTYAGEEWSFDVLCLVTRATDPAASWDALDLLISSIRTIVRAMVGASWRGSTTIGETLPIGGITYLSAVCAATVRQEA